MANMLFLAMLVTLMTISAVAQADIGQLERKKRQDDIHIYVDGGGTSYGGESALTTFQFRPILKSPFSMLPPAFEISKSPAQACLNSL
ncbi:unnamed protein product [Cylicostephanus goldi]|uniref:Carboxylesterase type B domain-containing protein n=1 Tax=Cylicostephanus goldi TaxID=71465 RepID=A0A3P7M8W2_CYLGO|nr:unnamed protein product [Cylicostephanus goldi]